MLCDVMTGKTVMGWKINPRIDQKSPSNSIHVQFENERNLTFFYGGKTRFFSIGPNKKQIGKIHDLIHGASRLRQRKKKR